LLKKGLAALVQVKVGAIFEGDGDFFLIRGG
jgi:hypothetical protein